MGNAGSISITRERQKSSLSGVPILLNSKDDPESEPEKKLVFLGSSQEKVEPYFTLTLVEDKSTAAELKTETAPRTFFDIATAEKRIPVENTSVLVEKFSAKVHRLYKVSVSNRSHGQLLDN